MEVEEAKHTEKGSFHLDSDITQLRNSFRSVILQLLSLLSQQEFAHLPADLSKDQHKRLKSHFEILSQWAAGKDTLKIADGGTKYNWQVIKFEVSSIG